MYASYGCNGAFHSPINLPRYRPIYISPGNLSRRQKKKKKKNQYSSKRYSGWCIIIVHGNGRGEILDVLELVSSQPTPGTDRVRYFPQLAKRALKPEIMRNNETINRKVMFQPIFAYLNFFRTIDRLGIGGKKNLWRSVAIFRKDVQHGPLLIKNKE